MKAASRWRDFFNRREPGARWMLVLLVLAAVFEGWWMFIFHDAVSTWHQILLLMTGLAVVGFRGWSLPSSPAFPDPKWEVPAASRRWVWLMAGAIAILAIWPRSARLNHSLTNDEIEQLVWTSSKPKVVTGHVAAGLATDVLGQEVGEKMEEKSGGPQEWAVKNPDPLKPRDGHALSERVIRTLPWIAGFLTAGLVVVLGAALGSPRAGMAAGLMLALHPGHIRWSSELADHAHLLLFLTGALCCLLQALRTNRWRWWGGLAACQACALLGTLGTMPFLLVLNGMGIGILVMSAASLRDRMSHGLRMIAALALAGVVTAIPTTYILTGFEVTPSLADRWSFIVAGVPWSAPFPTAGAGADIAGTVRAAAWRGPVMWGLLPLCVAAGMYFMLRQDWRTRLVAMVALAAFLLNPRGEAVIVFLPLLLAWAGAGLWRLFPSQPRLLHAPLFVAVVYVITVTPVLQRMIQIPQQPLREAAITARRSRGDNGAAVSFGRHAGFARIYDPGVHVIKGLAPLDALIDTAYSKDLPLFVYRMNADAADADPEWSALNVKLAKSGQFVLAAEFAGFDPRFGYEIYRYQPREQIINIEVKKERKK